MRPTGLTDSNTGSGTTASQMSQLISSRVRGLDVSRFHPTTTATSADLRRVTAGGSKLSGHCRGIFPARFISCQRPRPNTRLVLRTYADLKLMGLAHENYPNPLRSPADLPPPAQGVGGRCRGFRSRWRRARRPGAAGIGRDRARQCGFRARVTLDGGRRADGLRGAGRGACGRRRLDRRGRGQAGPARTGGARRAASTCANSSCSG